MNTITLNLAPSGHRRCGDCQLCCTLLPVKELQKGAVTRCRHQRFGTGCTVYNTSQMPPSCKMWSCAWLVDSDTSELSRPDRSHYVVDVIPDYIKITYNDGTPDLELPVVQVWLDPRHPTAHRDPALRAYLDRRGENGFAAVIRLNSRDGFTLFPPSMTGDGWKEIHSSQTMPESRLDHVLDIIGKTGAKL